MMEAGMLSRSFDFLSPNDMTMLERVLAATLPPGASKSDREGRAAMLVRLFQSGVAKEEELAREMRHPHHPRSSRPPIDPLFPTRP
jgi:hypothetical protein